MTRAKERLKSRGLLYGLLAGFVVLLLVSCLLPVIAEVWASFHEYTKEKGFGSAWVGTKYYKMVIKTPYLLTAIQNTLILSLLGGILPVLPGWLLGWLAAKSGGKSWVLTGALLLPAFFPGDFTLLLFASTLFPTMDAHPWLCYICAEGVRTVFVTAFLSAALGRLLKQRGRRPAEGAALGALLMLALGLMRLLSPQPEAVRILQTSMNLEYTEILSSLIVWNVPRFGIKTVVWVLQQLLQLPVLAAGTALMLYGYRKIPQDPVGTEDSAGEGKGRAVITAATALLVFAGQTVWQVSSLPGNGYAVPGAIVGATLPYLLLNLAFAALLMTVGGWLCSRRGGFLAVLCLLFSMTDAQYGQCILFEEGGFGNGIFASAAAAVHLMPVLLLGALLRTSEKKTFFQWCRDAAPFLVLFLGMAAVQCWTGVGKQEYFLKDANSSLSYAHLYLMKTGSQYMREIGGVTQLKLWLVIPAVLTAVCTVAVFGRLMDRRERHLRKEGT